MEPVRIPASQVRVKVLGGPEVIVVAPETPDGDDPAVRTRHPRRWVETVDQGGNKYTGEVVWDGDTLFQIQTGPNTEVVLAKGQVRYIKDSVPPKGRDVLMGRKAEPDRPRERRSFNIDEG